MSEVRVIQINESIFAENDRSAELIRNRLTRQGTLFLDKKLGSLPVAILQPLLDRSLSESGGSIDYVHEEETAAKLAKRIGAIAFLLPKISKDDFFHGIVMDGVLPRKTFSMGHAWEKRYYLECRKITED